jgi:hypothetical protein
MPVKSRLAFALPLLLLPMTAAAESFRCGKWVVNEDTTLEELLQKCGPPTSQESRTEDIKARNTSTGLIHKTGETTTEIWTYDRGPNASAMVVTIIDGRIKRIERLRK